MFSCVYSPEHRNLCGFVALKWVYRERDQVHQILILDMTFCFLYYSFSYMFGRTRQSANSLNVVEDGLLMSSEVCMKWLMLVSRRRELKYI